MVDLKALLLLSMLYLVSGDQGMIPGPIKTSAIVITNTTKAPVTTTQPPKTTTKATTTTTTTTSSTTTTPTSTTTKPTTTTTPSTTTTTSTTTTPTTTTTTAPPTTTTPPPPLKPGKWMANYTGDKSACLLLEAALQVDLVVAALNKTVTVTVPSTAPSDGVCGSKTENITIKFGVTDSVSFGFAKSNDSKRFDLETVMVTLKGLPGTNVTSFVMINQTKEYSTPVSNSYKCNPERALQLVALDKTMNYTGSLRISHFQVQAFMNATSPKFDEALDCEGSETPDVVPIAVGLALVTLVIIVLIAYLIGRRRSQARGYLSM